MWRASVHLYHSSLVWLEQRTEHLALLGVWEWTAQQTSRRVCMLTAVLEHSYEVRSVRTETPPPPPPPLLHRPLGMLPCQKPTVIFTGDSLHKDVRMKDDEVQEIAIERNIVCQMCIWCMKNNKLYSAWKTTTNSPKNVFLTNISATFRTVLIILKWKLSVKVKSHFFPKGECCAVTSLTLCTQLLFAQTSSHFFYDEIVVFYNVFISVQLCRLNVCVFGNVCVFK